MKRLIVLFFASLLVAGCSDSDNGGSSGGTGSLDCLPLAGHTNVPMQFKGTNYVEMVSFDVEANCSFAAYSRSSGRSSGQLQKVTENTYMGTGTTNYCPSGKFSVALAGSKASGFVFETDCI